ncbi:MAG: tetratricopeptide repeat protein [Pseudomonadales bacterium]
MANKKISKVFMAGVFAGILVLSGCGGSEERQAEYLDRAEKYYEADNVKKAKIEVKNVLQINPNNADARYLLGLIAEQDKNFRGAFGNFRAALAIDAKHVKSLTKVAHYYLLSNELETAAEKASLLLDLNPDNTDALALMGSIFLRKALAIKKEDEAYQNNQSYTSHIAKATEYAQQALAIDAGHVQAVAILTEIYAGDDPELALTIIGDGIANQTENASLKMLKIRLLASQDKPDEIIATYKQLIAEYPDNLLYPFQLVNFYLQDNRNEEQQQKSLAESTLRDLVKTKPEEKAVKLWLVEFLMKNRDEKDAQEMLETFVKSYPESFDFRDRLAAIYLRGKNIDKAQQLYSSVIDLDPGSSLAIEARTRLVEIALSDNRREDVEKLLAEIFALEPENVAALGTRAQLKVADNKLEAAIPDLRVILKNDPESVPALTLLGKVYERNNTPDLALDNYQRLLAVKPNNIAGLLGAARILMARNQADEALPLLEAVIKVNASHKEAVRLLTDLYVRDQRWDDALSVVAKLTESEPTMAMGYYLQGRVYLRKKDIKAAVAVLEKSHDLEPRGVESLSALISGYIALEQTEKALDYVLAHLKKYPEQVHARELLGGLYADSGDLSLATATLVEVVKEFVDRNSAYQLLARIYALQSKTDEIEKLYLEGLKQKPDNVGLRLMLAQFYQLQGDYQQAVDAYERILKTNPDALLVKNNLAALLLDYFNTPENLTRVAELTAELGATETPAFLDTAGWTQYKLGNYAQAISLLGAAAANGGKGAVYHYHLGMAYFKSDMKVQAKEQLELALTDEKVDFSGKEDAQSTLNLL